MPLIGDGLSFLEDPRSKGSLVDIFRSGNMKADGGRITVIVADYHGQYV